MAYEFREGEELAIKCLKAKGYDIIDRRNNPLYWKMDIDFTALYGKDIIEIEIKWD